MLRSIVSRVVSVVGVCLAGSAALGAECAGGLDGTGGADESGMGPELVTRAADLGTPFDRYQTKDEFARDITFYLSTPGKDAAGGEAGAVPLIVWVQGSGCTSVFSQGPGGRVSGGIQMLLRQAAGARARVLVVEKPGVNFLDNPQSPGSAMSCSETFNTEQTLERWSAAVGASLEAALTLPGVDAECVLVAGHSEGGIVAATVAAEHQAVTHVAVLANGGPTQLYDMAEIARKPRYEGEPAEACERRVDEVYRAWGRIMEDPMSTTKFEWGHPYRRWSTFLAASTLDALVKTKARVFIAYGTEDTAVPVTSCDVLRAELVRRGRDVTCERIVGVDHGYAKPGEQGYEGLKNVMTGLAEWYLTPPASSPAP